MHLGGPHRAVGTNEKIGDLSVLSYNQCAFRGAPVVTLQGPPELSFYFFHSIPVFD